MSTRGVTARQAQLFATRAPTVAYVRPSGNLVRGSLAVLACAVLFVLTTASTSATISPSGARLGGTTIVPRPGNCPLTTKFVYGTNCLVDEGLRPCLRGSPGCVAVTVGPGSASNYFVPVPNGNLRASTSTTTVQVGGSVTVKASVAAPVCTYALLNAPGHPRCWDNLTFGGSGYYMPTNYNSEFTPPRLSFPSSCSVEGETSRDNPMSCAANVLPPLGGRVLPGHYLVVVVEVELNRGGALGDELDIDEVPLEVGRHHPPLIVNSTGTAVDEAEVQKGECDVTPSRAGATCTLAQAIAISNSTGGMDIDFDIPHGHGNTFDGTDPEILYGMTGNLYQKLDGYNLSAPTTVDGSSQPGSGRVELVGPYPSRSSLDSTDPGLAYYLHVHAGLSLGLGSEGSVIRGLVIDGFLYQIALYAANVTVERCYLGIKPAHGLAVLKDSDWLGTDGIYVGGSHDTIGAPGDGNVIAGQAGRDPAADPHASRELRREWGEFGYGLGADVRDKEEGSGEAAGNQDTFQADTFVGSGDLYDLDLAGSSDQIGGADSGAGNTFDGGASLMGASAVVQGNTFGGQSGEGTVWTGPGSTIGGKTRTPGTGAGNVFDLHSGSVPSGTDCASKGAAAAADPRHNNEDRTALVPGRSSVVQGNLFKGGCYDIGLSVEVPGITVGGTSADAGNLFEGFTSPSPAVARHYAPLAVGGIHSITATTDPEGVTTLQVAHPPEGGTVTGNTFSGNVGNAAVDVYQGSGITIYDNRMVSNSAGIILGGNGYVLDGDAPQGPGPNDYLEYPQISKASEINGKTEVTVILFTERAELSGSYDIDLYGENSCLVPGKDPGQGETYIGRLSLPTGALGSGHETLSFPSTAAPAVTATATDAKGDTSEFGACMDVTKG